jgi:cytochrome P450
LRLLARHPNVLSNLRAEVELISGLGQDTSLPTCEQLKKIKYLDLVLKEVLRLYPSVPVNSCAALKTTILPVDGGSDGQSPVLVRKGETVGYCIYVMHRRKDLHGEDSMQFVSERWEDCTLLKDISYGYLPFNSRPGVCLGQDFALLEAGYTVARIIQRFPYKTLPKGDKIVEVGKEKQTLVVAPEGGCGVQLRSSL